MNPVCKSAALFLAVVSVSAHAKNRRADPPPAEVFTALTRCRAIAADQERLACFDLAIGKIETAVAQNELYVVDKKQVRETRKTLFGLSLPDLGLFGSDSDDKNQVSEVELVVRSAQPAGDGWRMVMEDGSVWLQTDGRPLGRSPKPGAKVIVKQGSLGSFKASVSGQPAIKVKRVS